MASTPLLTRAQTGLLPPRSVTRLPNPEGLTIHYGGDSPWRNADRSSPAAFEASTDHRRCASIWRAWQAFHFSPGWGGTVNGGADIAYNSGFCPHGVRLEGRGPGVRSGAQGTNAGNSRSLASVYIAGGSDPLTVGAMLAALDEAERLVGHAKPTWQHGDWKATACAGPSVRAWKANGWPSPAAPVKPPTTPPVLPPTTTTPGGLTMADINKLLEQNKELLARLDRIEKNGAQKAAAFRDPDTGEIWIVGPDGYRRHLPNPGHNAVNLEAFIGVLRPGGDKWVHPISSAHLALIPIAE